MMMILKNAVIFYQDKLQKLDIEVLDGKIAQIGEDLKGKEEVDLTGLTVTPGLVDIHTHACAGYDFCTATPEEMDKMCRFYASHGVTAVAPAGMTLSEETLTGVFALIGEKMRAGTPGATILGVNMEGPYLSPQKKGAHDAQYIVPPDANQLRRLQKASGNAVAMVDISPCFEGAMDFIREVSGEVVVSLAHTEADYDTACKAIEAGASNVTHLFNAMNPLHHRDPGLIGAAFDKDVTAELICDGIHIHPAVIRTAFCVLGKRAVLVSDSMSAAGMADGEYTLGGLEVIVRDGKATLRDGTIAGSTITLDKAVQNAISFGIAPKDAIYAATTAPARAVRQQDTLGTIQVGRKADLAVFDNLWNIHSVYVGGQKFC
ncbi:MAG: N-acetylglucosamine-6-phosphate deacetylase [Angelakisella sp.]|nr:N-acetylglucosamine-6-phosphate deacetylase [Angelakisella sp.]